jgi:hypothetical protein
MTAPPACPANAARESLRRDGLARRREAGASATALVVISELQCAHLLAPLHHPTRAAGGLMAKVKHIGDVVDLLGAWAA